MGPTLGPIAADIISINLGKNPRFSSFLNKARQLNKVSQTVEDQDKAIRQLKQIYQDQASDLDKQAANIRQIRKNLAVELVKGNITRQEHLDRVADLEALAQSYENTADKLRRSSDRLNPAHIIKILGSDFFNQSVVKIRNIINHELNSELNRFLRPDLINTFLSDQNSDQFIQLLLSNQLDDLSNRPDFEDLKQNILIKIRQMLQDDSQYLKDNWQQKMQDIINTEIKNLDNFNTPTTQSQPTESISQSSTNQSDSINGCDPGYIFVANTGRGCVQKDCKEGKIPNAHLSYTGDCVCGSSGSINENPNDPNKECSRNASFESCPGCVYACVNLNQDCPQ